MIRIPAPYRRGLTVLTIGAALMLGHAALAASGSNGTSASRTQMALGVSQDGEEAQQDIHGMNLAENCYLEVQKVRTPQGRTVTRMVHECD